MSITLKLIFSDQIRKLKFTRDSSYDNFLKVIFQILKSNNEELSEESLKNLKFQYTDEEGDTVTFSSEIEWRDIIQSTKSDMIKITVLTTDKKSSKEDKKKMFQAKKKRSLQRKKKKKTILRIS